LLTPLSHHNPEGFHFRLQLAVLLSNPRSYTCGLLQLVLNYDLLPLSYVTLLAGLVMLTESTLARKADEIKIGLKLL
jgi:hypothetical protein